MGIFKVGNERRVMNRCIQRGHTPLHEACFQENIEIIQILFNNGADLDAKNMVCRGIDAPNMIYF